MSKDLQATGVATPWKKWLLGAFLALLGLLATHYLAFKSGFVHGTMHGVDFVHQMCYNNGGIIIDEQGRAIVCGRLTQVPQKELDKFDKV